MAEGLAKLALIYQIDMCRILGVQPNRWPKRVALGIAAHPHSHSGNRMQYRRRAVKGLSRRVIGLWGRNLAGASRAWRLRSDPKSITGVSAPGVRGETERLIGIFCAGPR
jgi:hypothetical protein